MTMRREEGFPRQAKWKTGLCKRRGSSPETSRPRNRGPPDVFNRATGLCFREQMSAAIRTAVQEFVGNAARFSSERFLREFADAVNFALAERA